MASAAEGGFGVPELVGLGTAAPTEPPIVAPAAALVKLELERKREVVDEEAEFVPPCINVAAEPSAVGEVGEYTGPRAPPALDAAWFAAKDAADNDGGVNKSDEEEDVEPWILGGGGGGGGGGGVWADAGVPAAAAAAAAAALSDGGGGGGGGVEVETGDEV
jgi:hypothetical protein